MTDFWEIYNKVSSPFSEENLKTVIRENGDDFDNCIKCKKSNIYIIEGNYVCQDCGIVLSKAITSEQEWRYYGESDNKSTNPTRVGMSVNYLLPQSSLGSIIDNRRGDHHNSKIRRYHQWNAMPYKERSLYAIFSKLQVKAKAVGIPKIIIEDAKRMYKTLSETRISRGTNRKGLEAACIYIACKLRGVPRSAKEIALMFDLKISAMTRGCKKFQEIMNLTNFNKKHKIRASGPLDFIGRYCSKLGLDDEIKDICLHVAEKAHNLEIVDENTPSSIAAGSIFLVIMILNLPYGKNEVSIKSQVSSITIAKVYKKIYQYRSYLFPKDITKRFDISLY